jgi:hypothetical protein
MNEDILDTKPSGLDGRDLTKQELEENKDLL